MTQYSVRNDGQQGRRWFSRAVVRRSLHADRRHKALNPLRVGPPRAEAGSRSQRVVAKRWRRTTALSSALRKFERSRGPKALGPDVACPIERRWSIRSRVASAMPIELSLKRFPCGAMTSAPDFTHQLASGTSDVTTIASATAALAVRGGSLPVRAAARGRSRLDGCGGIGRRSAVKTEALNDRLTRISPTLSPNEFIVRARASARRRSQRSPRRAFLPESSGRSCARDAWSDWGRERPCQTEGAASDPVRP